MEGNWNGQNGANKIQYNGKEWNDDFGLGWNDYGARFYDPAIGRFPTIDPLALIYSNINPYAYVKNNPINLIDPTGMASEAYNAGSMKMDFSTNYEKADAENKRILAQNNRGQGQSRAVTADDIAASGTPYGHYLLNEKTGERSGNVIEGWNFECDKPCLINKGKQLVQLLAASFSA